MSREYQIPSELLELGRNQGGRVSLEQVERFLAVDEMTTGAVADVLVRLEDAGIEVAIDDALLRPGVGEPFEPVTLPEQAEAWDQPTVASLAASGRGGSGAAAAAAATVASRVPRGFSWIPVAAVAIVLILGIILSQLL